jgi:nucleolar protein 12
VQSVSTERMRKRKRKAVEEDLEDSYMKKLQESDENNFKNKKAKEDLADNPSQSQSKIERDNDDGNSDSDDESAITEEFPINHETLINPAKAALDKSARTVFLGNVPSNVICSKTDYRALKKFFSAPGKISSVRFRSIAFSEQIPRKAAFVNHKLHEKQKTVNAYVVYKEVAFARAALELNGSVVLDRHIRVDSVAHPGKQDTRRCVFVGNLDFEAQEENLWRHFGACGKVEYVRVVRDSKTNVGKGFAYVQFEVDNIPK